MPTVVCKTCGATLRIAGLAAICPRCGNLVRPGEVSEPPILDLAPEPEPAPVQPVQPLAPPRVQSLPPTPAPQAPKGPVYILAGILGAIVLGLLVAVAILVAHVRRPIPPIVIVAPPAPIASPASQPGGSSWFSEGPAPASERAPPAPAAPAPVPPPVQAPVAVAPPASAPVAIARPHAKLAALHPRAVDSSAPGRLTDAQIASAIARGLTFLNSQFVRTRLTNADQTNPQIFAGMNALAIYALLQGGKSMSDERLGPQTRFVQDLLDRLKEYPMTGSHSVYGRSLRIAALTVYNRPQDHAALEADYQWLMRASNRGAYTYDTPTADQLREKIWDNSNSQYGALGIWAAMDAGFRAPNIYWADVEQHWLGEQTPSGGWGYWPGSTVATLSMTAAGTNMLFVARDQIAPGGNGLSKPIQRALEWLDDGDNIFQIDSNHHGYTLYSLERAGLACGYKFFGKHNWYEEFARQLVASQLPNGSWSGGEGTAVETSFDLLFLVRGRQPIFLSKLQFDGDWNNRPREAASLTRFASYQLERPLNWEIATLDRDWWEWSDSPVLLITSTAAPKFDDDDVSKLRQYALSGGTILVHAERDSTGFDPFVADLAARLFPDLALADLPRDHPIYSSVFPMESPPPLKGVSNGSRLLLIYSPTDLTSQWQPAPARNQRGASEMGVNIVVFAAGKRDLRNRLDPMFVPAPTQPEVGKVPIARLKYRGNWNPEPAAWVRASHMLQYQTGLALDLQVVELPELKYRTAPIAHLTGQQAVDFTAAEVQSLRSFVSEGGTLLIDCLAGSSAFGDCVENKLLPQMSNNAPLQTLPESHPLLLETSDGMKDIHKLAVRTGTQPGAPPLRYLRIGDGMVIFTRLDLISGLLGVNTVGIAGFEPAWSQDFVDNLVLYTLDQIARQQPAPH